MKFNFLSVAAILCLCAIVCGCSKGPKKPSDLPKLYPATVTVTYDDGSPVEGATVALLSQTTGGRTWNLTGVTDATGKLVLRTDGNWDGAPAGSYNAIVTKEIGVSDAPTEKGGSETLKSITRYVDEKYNNPKTSGLTVEIKEGDNQIELKVGEKVEQDVKVAG
ncbi:MAG: carboxypeptidase regulatory-like domain-containing protein [Thermoguttaceae bacterium]|nr:carboxypeptidase regulatory-like domain-containing protein [Thermoguttaceae bacterium]